MGWPDTVCSRSLEQSLLRASGLGLTQLLTACEYDPSLLPAEATVSYADYWSRRLGTIGHLKVSLLFTSGSWLESPVPEAIAALPSSKDLENDSANP